MTASNGSNLPLTASDIDGNKRPSFRYYDLLLVTFVTVLLCSNLIGAGKVAVINLPGLGPVSYSALPGTSGGSFREYAAHRPGLHRRILGRQSGQQLRTGEDEAMDPRSAFMAADHRLNGHR